jgi:hypothetical protein
MSRNRDDLFRTALQVLAVVCLVLLFTTIFHKVFADISALARQYSGSDFWAALARQLIRNLAGG